jgi:hypothetical protein
MDVRLSVLICSSGVSHGLGFGFCLDVSRASVVEFSRLSATDTERTMLLNFSTPCQHNTATDIGVIVPRSSTFPPLLVSRPKGALQVGQYWDSNSLMYS